jgi:hypothetical protein
MRDQRFNDPQTIDAAQIARLIEAGVHPVVQFSGPCRPETLEAVNALCAHHGPAIEVRFYGLSRRSFDCRELRRIPAVASLSLDCLAQAEHLDELLALEGLEEFALGIEGLAMPSLLASPAFQRLTSLRLGPTAVMFSLAPLAGLQRLRQLALAGQTADLDALGGCPALARLRLISVGRDVPLGFLNRLASLRSLGLLLGGREHLAGLHLPLLEELEVEQVRGLARLDLTAFPGLRKLMVRDQSRLQELVFPEADAPLEELRLASCKQLGRLEGMGRLTRLRALTIYRTAIPLRELLSAGLPKTLQVAGLYSGKAREDAVLRKDLDALGYTEFSSP